MVLAALFSGGKDSTLALLRALELVERPSSVSLVFTVPSFPFPSPHYENMACVWKLAGIMGLPLSIVKLPRGGEQEVLAQHLRRLRASMVVAGDVFLEEHLLWHERVAAKAGVELVEPLYNAPTPRLYWEAVERGIEFTIIACRPPCPKGLLGENVNRHNARRVFDKLEQASVDPLGELGEYHTLVTRSPLTRGALVALPRAERRRGPYGRYLLLDCSLGEGLGRQAPEQALDNG